MALLAWVSYLAFELSAINDNSCSYAQSTPCTPNAVAFGRAFPPERIFDHTCCVDVRLSWRICCRTTTGSDLAESGCKPSLLQTLPAFVETFASRSEHTLLYTTAGFALLANNCTAEERREGTGNGTGNRMSD